MRRAALAALTALLATPVLAQGTVSPTPAHENAFGVTTGSPLSGAARAGATSGSAMSTAQLPPPGARTQQARRSRSVAPSATPGGRADREAPMKVPPPPR